MAGSFRQRAEVRELTGKDQKYMVSKYLSTSVVEVALGIFLGLVVLVVDQYLTLSKNPFVNWFFIPVVLITFLVGAVKGNTLRLFTRTFITSIFYIWGVYESLLGRVVNVQLTVETLVSTVAHFFFFSYIFLIYPLAKMWRGRTRLYVFHLFPVISMLLALAIADIEERIFISMNPDGAGPTIRWSVNIAWLAYESESDGSPRILRGGS